MQKSGNLNLNLNQQYSDPRERNNVSKKIHKKYIRGKSKDDYTVTENIFDKVTEGMKTEPTDSADIYIDNGGTNGTLGLETSRNVISANVVRQNNNDSYYINNNNFNSIVGISEDNSCRNFEIISSDVKEDCSNDIKLTKPTMLNRIGNKSVALKRVSFGSSKGSMVETLVFETPTPLSEHVEQIFEVLPQPSMDDSGIDLQEELQRSIVRVSIYQSIQPRQVCPPGILTTYTEDFELLESFSTDNFYLKDNMSASEAISCDRQQSTDSGWDNPFRPGGDLSREADEIVNMIKGGKPITPTDETHQGNGNTQAREYSSGIEAKAVESVLKKNVAPSQSVQNGTTSVQGPSTTTRPNDSNGNTHAQVSNKVVPGPTSASHVLIGEKKNKKKGCCVIQ